MAFSVSKKVFILILLLTGIPFFAFSFYLLKTSAVKTTDSKVVKDLLIKNYNVELKKLSNQFLLESNPNSLEQLKQKMLETRVPAEYRGFHLRLVTLLDKALNSLTLPSEAAVAEQELRELLLLD